MREYGHEHKTQEHPHPQGAHDEYRGYRIPPTREEELKILEEWKTKTSEFKTKIDTKLAKIEARMDELKKEA